MAEKEKTEDKRKIQDFKDWKDFKTTKEIYIPELLANQIVGQEGAVDIIKKAAKQRRNVLLIGEPGTGKSMLGQAMAEMLPMEELQDVLVIPNKEDENNPKIRTAKAGEGKKIMKKARMSASGSESKIGLFILSLILMFIPLFLLFTGWFSDVIIAAYIIVSAVLVGVLILSARLVTRQDQEIPKLLINNADIKKPPFIEATGAHAGALLGDVKHDPLQSGGLGTPAHLRVLPGLIHKANKGVLFVDEIGTMDLKVQHDLLTAMQNRQFHITGRSEMSSGAMVVTEPVPCDFVLVAAGNIEILNRLHPALRSRIQGYGYEVYMNEAMEDNDENRKKIVQLVAQEVVKDAKIPHFEREAVEEILRIAKKREGHKGKITLRLRELGGLVRAAGDIAIESGHKTVNKEDVKKATKASRTLEEQVADKYVEKRKEYEVIKNKGEEIGRVNGLAVIGNGGIVLPIVAEITAAESKYEGKVIATGKLGDIAKEAVNNVSAIVKKYIGKDISNYDIHIQFLQTYEGVEGDSASVSVAVAVLSALEGLPVKQYVAMTGSLDVRGEVLPVGGITPKVEAAIEAGMKEVIIPKTNRDDLILDQENKNKIKIVEAETIGDVLKAAISGDVNSKILRRMR
ncbi:MAG: ATP-dependent protease LonB [Candidatus Altiarchaeota archaeon]|nr:ATP-dependent protease LonB [Candidatus Altiarchaeota archaeon]